MKEPENAARGTLSFLKGEKGVKTAREGGNQRTLQKEHLSEKLFHVGEA